MNKTLPSDASILSLYCSQVFSRNDIRVSFYQSQSHHARCAQNIKPRAGNLRKTESVGKRCLELPIDGDFLFF